MSGFNPGCPNYLDDGDTRKCFLLGYRICCGSKECKEALEREENSARVTNQKKMVRHDQER